MEAFNGNTRRIRNGIVLFYKNGQVVDIMYCRECPYGKEDFEKMMSWYEITATEKGMPNDIYHDLKPEDAADEFEKFLWCDKVGGKTFRVGRCEDAYIQSEISQNYSKQKRRGKR